MWGGTLEHQEALPCFSQGITRSREGYFSELAFENGGGHVERSRAGRMVYELDFPTQNVRDKSSLYAYNRFAQGLYGDGYFYFCDPALLGRDINVLSPQWSAPALIERGHKRFTATEPTYVATAANDYGYPAKTAVLSSTGTAMPTFRNGVHTLLIPPGRTLHLGAVGTSNGAYIALEVGLNPNPPVVTGQLYPSTALYPSSTLFPASGGEPPVPPTQLPLQSATSAPTFSVSLDGNYFRYVRIYIAGTGTMNLTAMFAQWSKTGSSPRMNQFVLGEGFTGLEFRGDARPENYVFGGRENAPMMGLSVTLVEEEQWNRPR